VLEAVMSLVQKFVPILRKVDNVDPSLESLIR
jgi:hypothetical protein